MYILVELFRGVPQNYYGPFDSWDSAFEHWERLKNLSREWKKDFTYSINPIVKPEI